MRRLLKKKRENAFKDFHVYYNDHNKIIYYLYYHIYCHSLQVFLSFLYSQKPNRRFRIFSEITQNFLFFIFSLENQRKKKENEARNKFRVCRYDLRRRRRRLRGSLLLFLFFFIIYISFSSTTYQSLFFFFNGA